MAQNRVFRIWLNKHLKESEYAKWLKTIGFCLDNPSDQHIVLGWAGIYTNYQIDDYNSFAEAARDNDRKQGCRANAALTYFGELEKDDLVWTKDASDNWWLCRVLAPAEPYCRTDMDIGAAAGVEAYFAGKIDLSKYMKMNLGTMFKWSWDMDFVAFSRYMFNVLSRRREYRGMLGKGEGIPRIFSPFADTTADSDLDIDNTDINLYPKGKAVLIKNYAQRLEAYNFQYKVIGNVSPFELECRSIDVYCKRIDKYLDNCFFTGFESDPSGKLLQLPIILSNKSGKYPLNKLNKNLTKIIDKLRKLAEDKSRYSGLLMDFIGIFERQMPVKETQGLHKFAKRTIDRFFGEILPNIDKDELVKENDDEAEWLNRLNEILIELLNLTGKTIGVLGLFRHSGNLPHGIIIYTKAVQEAAYKRGIDYKKLLLTVLCHEMYHFRHFMAVLAQHGRWETDYNIICGGYVSEALATYSELRYAKDNNFSDVFQNEYDYQKKAGDNGGYSAGAKILDNGKYNEYFRLSMSDMPKANEKVYRL